MRNEGVIPYQAVASLPDMPEEAEPAGRPGVGRLAESAIGVESVIRRPGKLVERGLAGSALLPTIPLWTQRTVGGTPMNVETRTTDAKARVTLPRGFANATVIIERVSETEIRIRKARVIPEDEMRFTEENRSPLSDRDRDRFLDLLDNPLNTTLSAEPLFVENVERA
jgi:hypothetical protein